VISPRRPTGADQGADAGYFGDLCAVANECVGNGHPLRSDAQAIIGEAAQSSIGR
jgi:hypothetical protein